MGTGVSRSAAFLEVTNFCSENNITYEKFIDYVFNNEYRLKKNSNYDTNGLLNPVVIGKYVFRIQKNDRDFTDRNYYLQARLKTIEDTPQTLKASVIQDYRDGLLYDYVDTLNNNKYLDIKSGKFTIFRLEQ